LNTTRHQKGYVFEKSGSWYLRYYGKVVQPDGAVATQQLSKRLAPVCRDYPNKRSVRALVDEFLLPINSGKLRPQSTTTIEQFVVSTYLPHVERDMSPPTRRTYKNIWKRYLKARTGPYRLRNFRTCDATQLFNDMVQSHPELARYTRRNIKSVLSGIFTHAIAQGALDGYNPVRLATMPKTAKSKKGYAHSVEEVVPMLKLLPPLAGAAVAIAYLAGLRKGEIRGLRTEDYDGEYLRVRQSMWQSHILPAKYDSEGDLPVVSTLAEVLNKYLTVKVPGPYLLTAPEGGPVNLDNLARRVIRPLFKRAGIPWHGWHAFRRGLGTNLIRLGVDGKTVQAILRHSEFSTTAEHYLIAQKEDEKPALDRLNGACTQYATKLESEAQSSVVN
jgi:integrase